MFGKLPSGKRLVTFLTSDSMTSDTLSKRPSKGISNKHLKGRIGSGNAFSSLSRTSNGHNSDMGRALRLLRRLPSTRRRASLRPVVKTKQMVYEAVGPLGVETGHLHQISA